ncbi:MAG: ribosome maturation factor RimM [Flavobacteriia bacterium]|jgi:16S rRNA processing protein RimM
MQKKDCFYLGIIAKLHGFKGEVSLFLDVSNPADYATLDAVFVEIDGGLVPFFVQNIKIKTKGFVAVKFQGVDSEQDAQRILKKPVYLPEAFLKELDQTSFYDHEIIGYTVIDEVHGDVGIVENVIDMAANPLLQLNKNGVEVLLPIFDGLVQKVQRKKKELYVKAPEGLIDLYLG